MSEPVKAVGRIEWQAFFILALVFGVGTALGVAVERARPHGPPPREDDRPPRPGDGQRPGDPGRNPGGPDGAQVPESQRRLPPFLEQLAISDSQRAQIHRILAATRPRVDSVMATVVPRLQAITDSTYADIGRVLTPAQRKTFEATRPRRGFIPGMPGGGRPGMGPGPDGRRGPPDGFDRGGPPPDMRDRRGPPPDGRFFPPDGRGPPPDGRGPPPDGGRPPGPKPPSP
ncbi:MAG: hypothetical protein HY275_08235 [Gemmatimonadetes bacterium]|nr:hypothetical protein [Gemmatimonadota bacterium]